MLSAEDILRVDDIEVREVAVPEWKGTVYLRVMDGAARDAYDQARLNRDKDRAAGAIGIRAKLLGHTICDKDGMLLFTDAQIPDLAMKSGAVIARLFDIACDMNGIGVKHEASAEKNSESGQSDDTGSN